MSAILSPSHALCGRPEPLQEKQLAATVHVLGRTLMRGGQDLLAVAEEVVLLLADLDGGTAELHVWSAS